MVDIGARKELNNGANIVNRPVGQQTIGDKIAEVIVIEVDPITIAGCSDLSILLYVFPVLAKLFSTLRVLFLEIGIQQLGTKNNNI